MKSEIIDQPLTEETVVRNGKAHRSSKAVKSVFIQLNGKNKDRGSKFRNSWRLWFKYWPN